MWRVVMTARIMVIITRKMKIRSSKWDITPWSSVKVNVTTLKMKVKVTYNEYDFSSYHAAYLF